MSLSAKLILSFIIVNNIPCKVCAEKIIYRDVRNNKSPERAFVQVLKNNQYFQDIFLEQPAPLEVIFGHVCENPKEWEQRFERKDMKNGRYQGKVRWGNEDGGYVEQYWDLNHRK